MRVGRDEGLVRSSEDRKLEPRLQQQLQKRQKPENVDDGEKGNVLFLITKPIFC